MQRMIEEFVTRDGTDLGEVGCSLEDKVRQVQQQLQDGRVRIVFDLTTQTANFVPRR
ncbi:MAG: YheU family protein [Desulfuromonadaceae bacterium]|nr:YheU family protein [Desulfuromonadaceae bacterium]